MYRQKNRQIYRQIDNYRQVDVYLQGEINREYMNTQIFIYYIYMDTLDGYIDIQVDRQKIYRQIDR